MGLFGPSDEELAKREIAARNKYVVNNPGQNVNISIDDMSYEDELLVLNRKKLIYKIIYSVCFIFLSVVFLLYVFGYKFSDNGITLSEFNQVRTGMSYRDVVHIIGEDGTLLSDVDLNIGPQFATQIYNWKGSNYSNANITFQGGKVVAKGQYGLK